MAKVAELSPDPANVRLHSERNLEAIAGSLRRFGQQKPIVIDAKGVVRAGSGTLEAARRLGWSEIWVRVSDLEGAELAAYAIADNRTAELAEWDFNALASTLAALRADGVDFDEIGWSATEVEALLAGHGVDDIAPDPGALAKKEQATEGGVVIVRIAEEADADEVERAVREAVAQFGGAVEVVRA